MKDSFCSLSFKAFIRFLFAQYMPNDASQLFGNHDSCHLPSASSFNLSIEFLHGFVMAVSIDRCLTKSYTQICIAILIAGLVSAGSPTVITSRNQAAIADKLLIARKAVNISNLCQNAPYAYHPDARYRHQ